MKKNRRVVFLMITVFALLTFIELDAHARLGGSRSSGSRGSRSFSSPGQSNASSPWNTQRQQAAPPPTPFQQQPAGGSFLRSFGGGLVGGLVGGMLFRSLGFAGTGMGMGGGGGMGLFDILIFVGIAYFIYRMFLKKKLAGLGFKGFNADTANQVPSVSGSGYAAPAMATGNDLEQGISYIRQADPYFDEARFRDSVMDIFFKLQGAWTNRNMTPVMGLLSDEMHRIFQEDISKLVQEKKINRLENIAVRSVDITEAWQETGQDFITALFYANLLDYTTHDTTGEVVAGSKTEPVKFEEYWTFTRASGNNAWKLSAINQK
ncbi:MAG: Tim44 domain-containing protein [Pseudomonadota bacterium]